MSLTDQTIPLATGTWTIDPVHSAVTFSVRHLGLAKVRGRFNEFSGSVTVGETVADTVVAAEIDLSSVDTNNADRDAHLLGSDFFDAATHPKMSFTSTGVAGAAGEYSLDGHLTINGVTKPVSLDVEFFGAETFPLDGSLRAGFAASGSISRSEFGVSFEIPMGADKVAIGDKVSIELDIQLVAPAAD